MSEVVSSPGAAGAALAAGIVRLGRSGAGRAEIACALSWTRARLKAVEAARPEVGGALERARDAELAWWEGAARAGVSARPVAALWSRAMAARFAPEGYGRPEERVRDEPDRPEPTLHERARAVAALLSEAGIELEEG